VRNHNAKAAILASLQDTLASASTIPRRRPGWYHACIVVTSQPLVAAMPITLTVTAGPQSGRRFTFDRHETFLIGRAPVAHFSLPNDDYFSRMHCLIEVNPPRCRLTDLSSRNGTYVNGARVQTIELKHGDEIRGGMTVIKVAIGGATPAVTLELPPLEPPTSTGTGGIDDLPTVAPAASPVIPGFQIGERLGAGSMGTVYRAVREADGLEVAVKVIASADVTDSVAVGRFLREASLMERLRHPNVVTYHGSGTSGRLMYFVMERVAGLDAGRLLNQEGPLEVRRAVRLMLQVLLGLDHAHQQKVVHRDVKPSNLLVTTAGGRERVKVVDFGLARAFQDSVLSGLTMTGSMAGTPHYVPPEQITDFRGVRPSADQYAAAATLYHLLTFRKVLTEEPVPLLARRAEAPLGLTAVIQRAMARRPEDRYADVRALAQAQAAFG